MTKSIVRASASAATLLLLAACGADGPAGLDETPPELLATWFATSLVLDGTDILDDGMRFRLTFRGDGSYETVATRDVVEFVCEGVWDCVDGGTFAASATEVVFDPGEDFETTLAATLSGSELRLRGALEDGTQADMRFVVPPIPEIVGTWGSVALLGPDGPIVHDGVETTLSLTFEADGTYAYAATASAPGVFCDVKVACSGEGRYEVDGASGDVTFDPQSADPTTMQAQAGDFSLDLLDAEGQWSFQRLDVPTPGEQGAWYAVSLLRDGVETADTLGWSTQTLQLDGAGFQLQSYHADSTDAFLCTSTGGPPECGVTGTYVAQLEGLELSGDLSATLSMEVEPLRLRLVGSVDGVQADIVYVRLPACSAWVAC